MKDETADVLADIDRIPSETQRLSKGIRTMPTLTNDLENAEVLIVDDNTTISDLMVFALHYKKMDLYSGAWDALAKANRLGLAVELHADEAPGDGYLRINLPTTDPCADLGLIRYADMSWTIEFDRRGDSRLPIDHVSKLGDDLHHAVWLANQLNEVTR
jgi:hypothetical protein